VEGNRTELKVVERGVHDISEFGSLIPKIGERKRSLRRRLTHPRLVLVGNMVGFVKEAALAAKQAGEFLKECRRS
jgi:hypothetical protein